MGDVSGLVHGHTEQAKQVPDGVVQVRVLEPAVEATAQEPDHRASDQALYHLPVGDGETTPVRNEVIEAVEEDARLSVVEGPVTISELVRGLNAMGVRPRDLIAILQAIKVAGALSAELELL